MNEILIIGYGAVGSICRCMFQLCIACVLHPMVLDSLVLKKSGMARVTVVARSNYEIVKGNITVPSVFNNMLLNSDRT